MYPLFPASVSHNYTKSERATAPGLVMDIRGLTFDDDTFDIAIDKGKPFLSELQTKPFGLIYAYLDRYDGRHDDSQGRCLGGFHRLRHPVREPPHPPTGSSATGHR